MTIETPRLTGRPLQPEDVVPLHRLYREPAAAAWLSAEGLPFDKDRTRMVLARAVEHWRAHGFGVLAFRERAGGRFVGYCGVRRPIVDVPADAELLYALRPAFWRRGLATEMARAVLADGAARHGLADVIAFTLPHNAGSRGVMAALGLRYERDIVHAGLPHVLYRLPPRVPWSAATTGSRRHG